MARTVTDYTALISGLSWWGSGTPSRKPTFLTYSFDEKPYEYLPISEHQQSFKPFTAVARTTARDALKQLDEASGIRFFEVPAGQGDVRFGNYDFSKSVPPVNAAGSASPPFVNIHDASASVNDQGGDVFINISNMQNPSKWLLLHEIGHALGLKHPSDGDVVLDRRQDNSDHTVMSYNYGSGDVSKLRPLDIAAIRALYGTNDRDGTQVAAWSWNATTFTLTQIGRDGDETIRGVGTKEVISGAGGKDIVLGAAGDDRLDGGAGDDRLSGDDGNDALLAGAGKDTAYGGAGHDRLGGGAGDDVIDGSLDDAPRVVAHAARVGRLPRIAAYLGSERRVPFSEDGIFRRYPELDPG